MRKHSIFLSALLCCLASPVRAQLPADRLLTDTKGRRLQATILSATGDGIRIRRTSDGKEFTLPLAELSTDDRTWLKARQADAAPKRPAVATPEPPQRVPDRPQPPPPSRPNLFPKAVFPTKEIVAAQVKAGLVPPPRGWDALETTIRFQDGRRIDGYVYDVQGERFWYAERDMVQKSAALEDLEIHSRLRIVQWRTRSPHAGSPPVALAVDGQAIHASIVAAKENAVDLLTEAGEWREDVPLEKFDTASRKFAEDWLAGKWEPKGSEWAIDPKYTMAMPPFRNGHALVRQEGKWGVIRSSGDFETAPTFDDVVKIPDSTNVKLRLGDKWGLMEDGGRIVLAPEWEDVGDLQLGMIPVRSGGKWGYAQDGGKLVIPCAWDDAWRFSHAGTAVVTRDGKRGFVDRAGKAIVEPEWDGAIMHSPEGIGAVRRGKGWALVDQGGKLLCEPVWNFRWAERRFELGYIPARPMEGSGGWTTLLGTDGKPDATPRLRKGICLPRQPGPFLGLETNVFSISMPGKDGEEMGFDEISPTAGGLAAVRKGKLWGYADAGGLVLEPRWDRFGRFSQGIAAVTEPDGTQRSGDISRWPWQWIDAEGKTVIPVNQKLGYRMALSIKPWAPMMEVGRIGARGMNRNQAWMDGSGRMFSDSLSNLPEPGMLFPKAEEKRQIGLVDTGGKILFPPEFEEFVTHSSHWIGIKKDGKWGLADRTGKIVVAPYTTTERGLPVIFPGNGTALIGRGMRQRIFWPDQTELKGIAERKLEYVDEYGPHLIFKKGQNEETEWWIARREPEALWKIEGASRIYWNKSMVEFERIWIEDQATKRWHFTSIDGRRLGPELAEKPGQWFLDGGLGIIREGDGCHFIDKDGQKAGVGNWQDARIFRNGMAAVKRDGRWGFIDPSGKLQIECRYEEAGDFFVASRKRGDTAPLLAAVCLQGGWGYINPEGKPVIALEHDTRGSWQFGRVCFANPERRWEIHTAYEPDGKRVEGKSQNLANDFWIEIRQPKAHRHAGDWTITEGEDDMKGLANAAGTVALEPEWRVIAWVAPGVVAVRNKHSGGLFAPGKGWLFQEDDGQRILRDRWTGGFDHGFLRDGLILTERPPRWGFARYRK